MRSEAERGRGRAAGARALSRGPASLPRISGLRHSGGLRRDDLGVGLTALRLRRRGEGTPRAPSARGLRLGQSRLRRRGDEVVGGRRGRPSCGGRRRGCGESPGAGGCWPAWDAGGWRALSWTSGHRVGDMERSHPQRQKENKQAGRQTRNPQTKPELFSLLRARRLRSAWGADWLTGLV